MSMGGQLCGRVLFSCLEADEGGSWMAFKSDILNGIHECEFELNWISIKFGALLNWIELNGMGHGSELNWIAKKFNWVIPAGLEH